MIRKLKPKRKLRFQRNESNDLDPKRRKREDKQKYRHLKKWIENEDLLLG